MDAQLKRTSLQQLVHMVKFLEGHKYLAGGKLRSKEQAALSARLWSQCANILNADGEPRTPAKWKRYFNQYKSRLLARIRRIKEIQQGTLKGTESPLTELEERFAAVCDFETGAGGVPKLMLEINPLKQSNDSICSFKNETTSNYDSEQETSIDSDNEREEKPLIFKSEPNITLHEGVLTVNDPEIPILSRHPHQDEVREEKPLIFKSEPKIMLHEGVLTVNDPENPIFSRHPHQDREREQKPVIFQSEPKITLHEGILSVNNPENPILSRHLRKRRKSDVDNNDMEKKKDCSIPKCTNNRLEIFGQHVGMKLQALKDNQRIIAEKIINDAMFLAETGSLTMGHAMNFANSHHTSQN